MLKSIQDYLDTLNEPLKTWTINVITYIENHYPEYPLVLSYQRPMVKLKPKLFIMLGGGKNHFSLYTTDFSYVELYKLKKLPKIKFGKSAINFPINQNETLELAYQVIDDVILRSKNHA